MNKKNKIKIMIIDDDPMSLESLKSFLVSEGYHVSAFNDSFTAWDALKTNKYNVVASDYMLKEANGLEFLHRIKTIYKNTFTILFTGFSSVELLNKLSIFNIDLFLTKPIEIHELIEVFNKVQKSKSVEFG